MAEVVERNIEETLGEILYIKKSKLFNKSEINEIIRKRRQHEYALQKRNKRVIDYDAYITTELTVLKLLRFRRQKTDDRRYIDQIERSIISRLVRLHRQLCYRFQSRIDLWIRFIHFCKILGRHVSAVRLWNRLLQVHGRTEPRLWAAAASYHLHQNAAATVRTNKRKLDTETNSLAEQKRRVLSELKTLNQYLNRRKQQKMQTVLTELRQTRNGLEKAMKQLARERRLAKDRATLHALREARRLLTEGLTLNPQCKSLLVELAKLEACAADFFRTRVMDRTNSTGPTMSSDQEVKQPEESRDNGEVVKRRKKLKGVAGSVFKDNARFMADITEDVPFVASGQAFRLVANSLLDQWASDQCVVTSLQQLITSIPHLADDSLKTRLFDSSERLKSQPNLFEHAEKETVNSAKTTLQTLLDERLIILYNTVQSEGIDSALRLWDSWFSPSGTDHSPLGTNQFRFLDPESVESMALLRLRLKLCSLRLSWSTADQSTESAAPQCRTENAALVRQTRSWLDEMSTSPWGLKSAEFWISYVQFERDSGDCTRIPAIQWRASKTLLPEAYQKFTQLLNELH